LGSHGIIFGQKCPIGETLSDGIVRLLSYAHLCDGCVSEDAAIFPSHKRTGGQMAPKSSRTTPCVDENLEPERMRLAGG
jgi:hypothetical protein